MAGIRISKKLRTEAALLCSAAAGVAAFCGRPGWLSGGHWLVRELDVVPEAGDFADKAHDYAISSLWRLLPVIWLPDTLAMT